MMLERRFDPERATRDQLIDRIDMLEGRVAMLAEAFGSDRQSNLSLALGISGAPVRIMLALADGKLHSKQSLLSAIYFDRAGDEPEIKIIDVWLCRLRKILSGTGVVIETVWGSGYVVSGGLDRLGAAIETGSLARDGQATGAPTLRAGRVSRPFGYMRDRALQFLHERADDRGHVVIRSRALSQGIGMMNAGSCMIQSLERSGYLTVIKRGRRGGGAGGTDWTIRLTERGR